MDKMYSITEAALASLWLKREDMKRLMERAKKWSEKEKGKKADAHKRGV